MESLSGAVAYLTLVDKARKPVSFFQEAAEVYDDLQNLKQQISIMDGIVQYYRETFSPCPSDPTPSHKSNYFSIASATHQLEEIRRELSVIVTECAQAPNSKLSLKRLRLLQHRTKISRLVERFRDERLNLYLIRLEAMFEAMQNRSSNSPENEEMEKLSSLDSETDQIQDSSLEERAVDQSNSIHMTLQKSCLDSSTNSAVSKDLHVFFCNLKPYSLDVQKRRCKRCLKQNRIQGPVCLQPLVGLFLVDYTIRSGNGMCKCSESQIWPAREPLISLQYQLPPWLWARECLIRATYSNFSLSFALRPARVLNINDPMWGWIDQYSEDSGSRGDTLQYYPHDRDIHGEGLIEYGISCGAFGAIKVLLAQWQNLLSEQGLPREAGIEAARQLKEDNFTDEEIYLLKEVIRWAKDMPDCESTKVHQAAIRGWEMKEALKEEAWALNEIDYVGHAPLHYAVREGNAEAVRELIAAGANIDKPDSDGWTPLMVGAKSGQVESMKLLLKAKCNIGQQNKYGDRAIHLAVANGRFEAVELLRLVGASASVPGYGHRTPLHYLAECTSKDHGTITKLTYLLLEDKSVSTESRDRNGYTPVMLALRYNNPVFLRLLVDNRASLKPISFLSRNILHIAAYYSNLELLECLLGLEDERFLSIYTELRDEDGKTPKQGLEWLMKISALERGMARYPSLIERQAFEKLYRKIRNGNTKREIRMLDEATTALLKQDSGMATRLVGDMITQKREWGLDDDVAYYRGIVQRIQDADFEGVLCALKGDISDLNDQLGMLSCDEENASASSQCGDNSSEVFSSEDENEFSEYVLESRNQDCSVEMRAPRNMGH